MYRFSKRTLHRHNKISQEYSVRCQTGFYKWFTNARCNYYPEFRSLHVVSLSRITVYTNTRLHLEAQCRCYYCKSIAPKLKGYNIVYIYAFSGRPQMDWRFSHPSDRVLSSVISTVLTLHIQVIYAAGP